MSVRSVRKRDLIGRRIVEVGLHRVWHEGDKGWTTDFRSFVLDNGKRISLTVEECYEDGYGICPVITDAAAATP